MLVTGLFDYAGLFPPARLPMQPVVENYARYAIGEHAWMLGRLACPVSRLDELTEHAAILMPGTHATSGYREHADVLEPWAVSAVIDGPLEPSLDRIGAFEEHHSKEANGLARVDAVEMKAAEPSDIDAALNVSPTAINSARMTRPQVETAGTV